MAEGGGLLNRCTVKSRTGGSNPPLTASFQNTPQKQGFACVSAESLAITDALLRKTLSMQTQQQMVLTAIAVARYRIVQGIEPPDLRALVPRFLPTLPRDWMDGNLVRYRPRPGGGFLLYSVGEDGKDDNGDPAPSKPEKKYRQVSDGRDAVWPVAASETEAEAAMKVKNE